MSSELIFEDILLPAFSSRFGNGATATKVPIQNPNPAYELKSSGTIDFNCGYSISPTCQGVQHLSTRISIPGEFKLSGHVSGLIRFYKPSGQRWNSDVQYVYDNSGRLTCSASRSHTSRWFEMNCDTFNAATTNSDGLITFPSFSTGVNNVDYEHVSNSGWDWFDSKRSDKNKAAKAVAECIKHRVAGLRFNVDSVSVFVLTNLIFPEAKVMKAEKVMLPGDMVVLGDVVKEYKPNPSL